MSMLMFSRKVANNTSDFHFLRRNAGCAWAAGFLAVALVWGQNRLGVLHPWSFMFIALLAATFAMGLQSCFLPSSWRLLWSSSFGRALAYIIVGLVPAALWAALAWYAPHQWSHRTVPGGFSGVFIRMTGASLAY